MVLIRRSLPVLFALLLVLAPASAGAQSECPGARAPSGNSELDQYLETVPGSCGDETINTGGPGGGSGGSAIPASTAKELRAKGADGKAAAQLAEETAPGPSRGGSSENVSSGTDDGMGVFLPLLLGGTLLAGILYLTMRRGAGLAS
jgi:hypothetical protein